MPPPRPLNSPCRLGPSYANRPATWACPSAATAASGRVVQGRHAQPAQQRMRHAKWEREENVERNSLRRPSHPSRSHEHRPRSCGESSIGVQPASSTAGVSQRATPAAARSRQALSSNPPNGGPRPARRRRASTRRGRVHHHRALRSCVAAGTSWPLESSGRARGGYVTAKARRANGYVEWPPPAFRAGAARAGSDAPRAQLTANTWIRLSPRP
jgi:hypothetical protein